MRDRLLADHCGVPPEEVTAAVARTGSLIAAAETLSRNGHALRPVEDGEADPPEIATYIESVADPEQPIGAEVFLDAVFGNGHGRRGPLIKIAAAALLLARPGARLALHAAGAAGRARHGARARSPPSRRTRGRRSW